MIQSDFLDAFDDQKPRTAAQILHLASLFSLRLPRALLELEVTRRIKRGTWAKLEANGFDVKEAEGLLGITTHFSGGLTNERT